MSRTVGEVFGDVQAAVDMREIINVEEALRLLENMLIREGLWALTAEGEDNGSA